SSQPVTRFPSSHTAPGFLPEPAGPSLANWIAPLGDTECCSRGSKFDLRVPFVVSALQPNGITITGTLAARGPVAAAVGQTPGAAGGVGTYLNNGAPFSLTALTPFSISVPAVVGTNYLDFIGSGCNLGPQNCNINAFEPVAGWLVDPTWTSAPPGTI